MFSKPSNVYWTLFTAWHALRDPHLPYFSSNRLRRLQDRRVRSIIRHAYDTVPYYREIMDQLHLSPSDIRSAADMDKLPITEGRDLARDPERFLSSAVDPDHCLAVDTTGTTGHYKTIHHDTRAVFIARAAGQRRRRVFARRAASGGPWRLERRSLESGRTQVIAPSSSFSHGGYRPRFSPDGSRLAFLGSSDARGTIVLARSDGSGARPVPLHGRAVSDFDWAPDGRSLVVAVEDSIQLIDLDGTLGRTLYRTDGVSLVSMAAEGSVAAYSRGRLEKNIWIRSPGEGPQANASRIIQSTAWDTDPAFSPDGSKIAFLSNRTGSTQLWVASRDGSHPRRLTEIDQVLPVPPSWAPTGDRIAIVVEAEDRSTVAVLTVSGGTVVLLPSPEGGESRPTWSRDGSALLVSRPAADGSDLWRRSADPRDPDSAVRLTRGGGYRGLETFDGRALLFTRVDRAREIWRSNLDGDNPTRVFQLPAGEILSWALVRNTLLVGSRRRVDDRSYRIVSYDVQSDRVNRSFIVPGRLGFHFDIDPTDPASIVFDRTETVGSDIMAIIGL